MNHTRVETFNKNSRHTDSQDGFTLFEIMAVLAILGVLLTIAVGSFMHATSSSHRMACLSNQRILNTGLQAFRADNVGTTIQSLQDLEPYVVNLNAATRCPADQQISLELDSATEAIICPNHQ